MGNPPEEKSDIDAIREAGRVRRQQALRLCFDLWQQLSAEACKWRLQPYKDGYIRLSDKEIQIWENGALWANDRNEVIHLPSSVLFAWAAYVEQLELLEATKKGWPSDE
jgi:hypothetical protein